MFSQSKIHPNVFKMFSQEPKTSKKPLILAVLSTLGTIRTRPWNFLDILKVPVFGRYLQVQMPKKATFRIQIKRFFHICFHEGLIPCPFITKLTSLFHSLLFTYQSNAGYVERIFYYDGIHVCKFVFNVSA